MNHTITFFGGWVYVIGKTVTGLRFAELIASPFGCHGLHCPKLWHLKQYIVSSVSGVTLWLLPTNPVKS